MQPTPANTLVVIPTRMAAMRLPGKPLADICGEPMIVRVWRRAIDAGVGPVLVAAAEDVIAQAVAAAGGDAILTDPALASGTDRVAAAVAMRDPDRRFRFVINLQGDLPTIRPSDIRDCLKPLAATQADIATLAAEIRDPEELENTNVVKAYVDLESAETAVADDFRREPGRIRPQWHHIGIYAYRRGVLERFVSLPPSASEVERRLEQLRAMDAGMTIAVQRVDLAPFGVDTPADLDRARAAVKAELSAAGG